MLAKYFCGKEESLQSFAEQWIAGLILLITDQWPISYTL